jgi:hypothetical protein
MKIGRYIFAFLIIFAVLCFVSVPNLWLQLSSWFRTFGKDKDEWKNRRALLDDATKRIADPDAKQPKSFSVGY